MTSIITAWLVKLATRILRDKLAALNDDVERLLLRLEARTNCVEYLEAENKRLQSIVTLHHRQLAEQSAMLDKVRAERDSHLTDLNAAVGVTNAMKDDLENIRTENEVLRRQLDNQAATIREYQAEKENLHCCIDVLQANVSGWSKLFDEMKHRMGMSEDRAKSLRREIDVFTVRKDSTTGAGSASQASDSAGGSTRSTTDGDALG